MTIATEANRSSSTVAFLTLLTFTSSNDATVLRVVNNNEDIVSNGETYTAYPFAMTMLSDEDGVLPTLQIQIDAVDQQIIKFVRELPEPPSVRVDIVLSNSPSTIQKRIDFLRMTSVAYDVLTVTATMQPEDYLSLPAVDSIYGGNEFPDLVSS